MASKNKRKKKKTVRVKPIPIIILFVVIISAITLVTVLAMKKGNKSKHEEKKSVATQNYTINKEELSSTTVKIDMEDCKVIVGTTLIATATVTPEGTQGAINWASSNNAILTVDSEGVITVKAPGLAVITATVGIVSDTVMIECVEAGANSKSQYNLPAYGEEKTSEEDREQPSKQVETVAPSKAVIIPTSTAVVSKGLKSTELHSELAKIGYSERVSDVYTFGEGDNYYGQVIIQSDLVIIYIKQRNDSYDAKIKSILSALLPSEGAQVWTNYVSSYNDRTFTAEGRRVRIVSAAKGGHSQIVIYN